VAQPRLGAEEAFEPVPVIAWVDRRKAIELRLDLVERRSELIGVDEAAIDHLTRIVEILSVASLELRQRLRVKVEVLEGQPPLPAH
jgi:hypothetical protein